MELLLLQSPSSILTCLATSATLRSRAYPRLASSSLLSVTLPNSFRRQTLSTHCLSSNVVSNAQVWRLENDDPVVGGVRLFPNGNTKHWLVRIAKLSVRVVTKAQMVDYCVQLLTKVMGNETDAQMCLYHVSWQNDFGFCCELDEECAKELAGVPGVLSVQPDDNFEMQSKNYRVDDLSNSLGSSDADVRENISTKKLFVTGLSFYTSEKTLRAAFESFGELVEVKIIMDKISKRSKGYAFIEYTTVEAAGIALREMNGKIINGWMIVVDVAKTNPPRYSRGREMP